MTELDAIRWVEKQPGLKMHVGKDRHITLTDGVTVYISGTGVLETVIKLQNTLKVMEDTREANRQTEVCADNVG